VEDCRDPAYAAGAQAYRKSDLPYLGVRTPDLRSAWRSVLPAHPLHDGAELAEAVGELWDRAEFRDAQGNRLGPPGLRLA
jgi:hypothetical protein